MIAELTDARGNGLDRPARTAPYRLLAVGATLDGVEAALALVGALPSDFPMPVALACERDPDERDALVRRLQAGSRLRVVEPDDKDDLEPGIVYLAPAGYHLLVDKGAAVLARDPRPVPPAPGPLFESAADSYGSSVAAVLLCAGDPPHGAEEGLQMVRECGGIALRALPSEVQAVVGELLAQPGRMDDRGR